MTKKGNDIKYVFGIVLLTIGVIGLTFMAFFMFIGLPIFIIGLILLLLSNKSLKEKLITIGTYAMCIFLFWFIWNRVSTIGPETFHIPNEYRGKVVIIFKPGCGEQLPKTKEGYQYEIPNDGILILDQELKTGFIDHSYKYIQSNGRTIEIPMMDVRDFNEEWTLTKNPNEPSRDKLGVFHWGRTGSIGDMVDANGKALNKDDQYDFQEFYISTYNELKDKFGLKYGQEFDERINHKLEQCK